MNKQKFTNTVFNSFSLVFIIGSIVVILEFLRTTKIISSFDMFFGPFILAYTLTPLLLLFGACALILKPGTEFKSKSISKYYSYIIVILAIILCIIVYSDIL